MIIHHSYISVRSIQRAKGVGIKAARMLAVGTALGHVKYIQHRPGQDRPGQDRPEGGREFFTKVEDSADPAELKEAIREFRKSGVVAHKLLLAPEINPADPQAFAREVMHDLESEKGLDLKWWAVVHRNTDHHHIHVVVLPSDANGHRVLFNKADYELMKESGRNYLERVHTFEYREAVREREEKKRERAAERRQERQRDYQERLRKGEVLPILHRKIVREQVDPYEQWVQKQSSVEAKGKTKQQLEYQGERYSNTDSYERLSGLMRRVNNATEQSERLARHDYRKLSRWMEQQDRQRFAGEIERQLTIAKSQQSAQTEARNSPAANRWVSPMQQELIRNPVLGLFLTEAAIASELVRAIPLTDQRDRLKESRDELESVKRDREAQQRRRATADEKARDEETIQKIDEAIEENKDTRKSIYKDRQKQKEKRDQDRDFLR